MSRLEQVKSLIAHIERINVELFRLSFTPQSRFYGTGPDILPHRCSRSTKGSTVWRAKYKKLHDLTKELYGKHAEFMKLHGLIVRPLTSLK